MPTKIVYVRDVTPNRATVCKRHNADATLDSTAEDLNLLASDPQAMGLRIWIGTNTSRVAKPIYPKRNGLL